MSRWFAERSWLWRRWAVFSSLAVSDVGILYLMIWGADDRLRQDIANGLILLVGAIVNGYVFGGIWDDRNKGKEAIASKAVDQADPVNADVEIKQ
jgi:hypothetical protein